MKHQTKLLLFFTILILMTELALGTEVFFFANDGNDYEIYSYNIEYDLTTQITDNDWHDSYPVLSPSRDQIYYSSEQSGSGNIWRMDLDGTNPTQLTDITNHSGDTGQLIRLDINPQGTELIFSYKISSSGGYFPIYKMNVDGSGITQISPTNDDYTYPRWSPDGTQIMSQRNTPYNGYSQHIVIFHPDGSNLQTIIPNESNYPLYPNWSPDGTQVVFARNDLNLYIANIDGTGEVDLSGDTGSSETYSYWASDGFIYYAVDGNVARVLPDGSASELLYDHPQAMGWMNVYPAFESVNSTIAHWDFNQGSGSQLTDLSGNAYHGVIEGATWTDGYNGGALSFDGVDDKVTTELVPIYDNTQSFTWEVIAEFPVNYDNITRIMLGFENSDDGEIKIGPPSQSYYGGVVYAASRSDNYATDGGPHNLFSNDSLSGTGWHHYALIRDRDQMRYKFYVDHVLTVDISDVNNNVINAESSQYLGIGCQSHNNFWDSFFEGCIDEIRISDVALHPTEFLPFSRENLLVSYPFNGNAIDVTGNGHDGVVSGAGLSLDRFGTQNSSYYFDGENDFINAGMEDAFPGTNDLTFSCWIKSPEADWSGSWPAIITKQVSADGTWTTDPFGLFLDNLGAPIFAIKSPNESAYFGSEQNIADNQWHLITVKYDQTAAIGSIYIDGELDTSTPTVANMIDNPNAPVYIGATYSTNASGFESAFEGNIDDVKIYNRLLSDAEIFSLYMENRIQIVIGDAEASPSTNALVPVYVEFPADSTYRAAELHISGYESGLNFVRVETDGSMLENHNWLIESGEETGSLVIAAAGSDEIAGAGVLCYLEFSATSDNCLDMPVNCDFAEFNLNEWNTIENGLVSIMPTPEYGDVNQNGGIDTMDASEVLMFTIDNQDFNCQQMLNADVNEDSLIDGMDASLILQSIANGIELPVAPDDPAFLASGSVSIPELSANSGDPLVVPLSLSGGNNVFSFQGILHFDTTMLVLDASAPISLASGTSGIILKSQVIESGTLQFAGASAQEIGSNNVMVQLNFLVFDELTTGDSTVISFTEFKLNHNLQLDIQAATLVATEFLNEIPQSFTVSHSFPNPFNPSTTIRYGLHELSEVTVRIYDLNGREVWNLETREQAAGWYHLTWNGLSKEGTPVPTGMYIAQIQSGAELQTIKMAYLK